MFLFNSGLEWVEIDTCKGDKHFLLNNLDLVKILDNALGEGKCIAKIQLYILQYFAFDFLLLSTPHSYKGFIGWLGKPIYTYAGIILLQNKVAAFICNEGAELVYGIVYKDFTYIIYKIKFDSYLKLLYIGYL